MKIRLIAFLLQLLMSSRLSVSSSLLDDRLNPICMDFYENKSWASNQTILVNYSILRTLTRAMFSKGIVRAVKNGYKIQQKIASGNTPAGDKALTWKNCKRLMPPSSAEALDHDGILTRFAKPYHTSGKGCLPSPETCAAIVRGHGADPLTAHIRAALIGPGLY